MNLTNHDKQLIHDYKITSNGLKQNEYVRILNELNWVFYSNAAFSMKNMELISLT